MPRLDLYQFGQLRVQVRVNEEPIWVGRGSDCQISLNDPEISRRHAQISWRDGHWEIRNEGRNGTRLNARLLEGPAALQFGDRIYLGAHAIVFQAEDAPVLDLSDTFTATTDLAPTIAAVVPPRQPKTD